MNNQRKKSYKIVSINDLKISYQHRPRSKKGPKVAIIFLSGYKSDMLGTKATFLDTLSKKIGYEYLRFDYSGHGLSEGKIEKQLLSENESTFIPLGCKHRLSNPGKMRLELIEVQSGTYLGEEDIIRFEDSYGRIKKLR